MIMIFLYHLYLFRATKRMKILVTKEQISWLKIINISCDCKYGVRFNNLLSKLM